MYGGVWQSNIDDLAQKTFINVWQGIPGIRKIEYLNSWSYRVMLNVWKNYCREHKARKEMPIIEELVEETFVTTRTPEDEYDYNEFLKVLDRKLLRLRPKHREAVKKYLLNAQNSKRGEAGSRANYTSRLRGFRHLRLLLKNHKQLLQN